MIIYLESRMDRTGRTGWYTKTSSALSVDRVRSWWRTSFLGTWEGEVATGFPVRGSVSERWRERRESARDTVSSQGCGTRTGRGKGVSRDGRRS